MWQSGEEFLAVYLVAAHHGKVRVSIRSMPGEVILNAPRARIARGMEEGDVLFAARLGGAIDVPAIQLDLTPTELGTENEREGWSGRMLSLIDEYGPFRLAYLELLLRSADERASAKAAGGAR
jgi:CRISPR-associated endonuclease/helicase Cas3